MRNAGSLINSAYGFMGDEDRARRLLRDALHASESGVAQLGHVPLCAVDKAVAVQKAAIVFEQVVDRPIAREDFFQLPQIVKGDCRNGEVERPADMLLP